MATNGNDDDGLNPRQRRLIAELLRQHTANAALEAAGVGASTLSRWRREPAFVQALESAQRGLFADGYAQLLSWQSGNLAELQRLASEADNDGIRLRAAVALESALIRRYELLALGDLERRIAALEAQL